MRATKQVKLLGFPVRSPVRGPQSWLRHKDAPLMLKRALVPKVLWFDCYGTLVQWHRAVGTRPGRSSHGISGQERRPVRTVNWRIGFGGWPWKTNSAFPSATTGPYCCCAHTFATVHSNTAWEATACCRSDERLSLFINLASIAVRPLSAKSGRGQPLVLSRAHQSAGRAGGGERILHHDLSRFVLLASGRIAPQVLSRPGTKTSAISRRRSVRPCS